MFFVAEEENPFEVGKALTLQAAAFLGFEFRHQLVNGLQVVRVHVAVDDEQVFSLGLLQQIGQLGVFVIGVHGEQHGADLGRGKLQRHPVRDVGGPDSHLFPFSHAQGHEPLGQLVHHIAELPVGHAKTTVHIDQSFVVRIAPDGFVQQLPQGNLAQRFVHDAPYFGMYKTA